MESEALFECGLPDPPDCLEDLALDEDWVSLLLDNSSNFGEDESFPLLDDLPECPEPILPSVPSPSSDVTQLSGNSTSQDDNLCSGEEAGSGTEQCKSPEEKKGEERKKKQTASQPSSSGESNSTTNRTKRGQLGKRKIEFLDEEKVEVEGEPDEEEQKRRARLMRNRESAQLSRQRKKAYVDDLEERVRALNATVAELKNTVSLISAENVNLRNQLAYFYHTSNTNTRQQKGAKFTPPPPVGMPVYPYPTTGYVPIRPASTAPPVPIPRLKTQATPVKSTKRAKVTKEESRGKTKKLASFAALGLLFFMFLFFPGIPRISQNSYSTVIRSGDLVSNRVGGRVLMSINDDNWERKPPGAVGCDGNGAVGVDGNRAVIDGSMFPANVSTYGNATSRFPTSLILPRDNKVVKVDGDLIIQAVLAGDKAAEKNVPALISQNLKMHRALPNNALPPLDEDVHTQQQILSDLGGTVFSTGMCSEVFQFEISPANSEPRDTATQASSPVKRNGRNHRRNLTAVPLPSSKEPPKGKKYNTSSSDSYSSRESSSLVVSIFNSKQADLARIFVVVLVDSVKYVTYSCMLPPQPQVVTA